MKQIFFCLLISIFFACGNKNSETEQLKEELNNQKEIIQNQERKISDLENDAEQNQSENSYSENNENEANIDALNLNVSVENLISFKKTDNGNIEDFLVNKDWVFLKKYEKDIARQIQKVIIYRNYNSDSEIQIDEFLGRKSISYSTTNQQNFIEILNDIKSNNFILKNSDYEMGRTFSTFDKPKVGDSRINTSSSKLYSNGISEIIVNTDEYIVVNGVENDKEGTYHYSENSKFIKYKISVK